MCSVGVMLKLEFSLPTPSFQVVRDDWHPQSRTDHGEHYTFELIGKSHRCNSCRRLGDKKAKAKMGSTCVRYKFVT